MPSVREQCSDIVITLSITKERPQLINVAQLPGSPHALSAQHTENSGENTKGDHKFVATDKEENQTHVYECINTCVRGLPGWPECKSCFSYLSNS